ncbi:MAG: hypothetical protein PHV63_04395 [Candidatus Daviesbacteria bacterium]|nr:hypothetical protein [Candidatus Daviesbacteria bacterium]
MVIETKTRYIPTDSIEPSRLMCSGNVEITQSPEIWQQLSNQYGVPVGEILYIDLNRSGIRLPNNEVRVNYRARFIATVDPEENTRTWFALPVRGEGDTYFSTSDGHLRFQDQVLANTGQIYLDTCDVSYQRGPRLLNLNSRSRGNCGGCTACVHNYKDFYDVTVLRDQQKLMTRNDIEAFFDQKEATGLDIASLQQIAVVTGLFGREAAVVKHMRMITETVRPRGFAGELMYFGCEVNSEEALRQLSQLGKFALVYAIDNFTKRAELLAKRKSSISIDTARDTLNKARKYGIATTFAYIAGIDSLSAMEQGFNTLRDSISRFPVVNIFQVQTPGQLSAMEAAAKKLEYYVKARRSIEGILAQTGLKPRRWENYRPLWYTLYNDQPLPANTFGD